MPPTRNESDEAFHEKKHDQGLLFGQLLAGEDSMSQSEHGTSGAFLNSQLTLRYIVVLTKIRGGPKVSRHRE